MTFSNFDPDDLHDTAIIQQLVDNAIECSQAFATALYLKEETENGGVLSLAFRADLNSGAREGIYAGTPVSLSPIPIDANPTSVDVEASLALACIASSDSEAESRGGVAWIAIPLLAHNHTAIAAIVVARASTNNQPFPEELAHEIAKISAIGAIALGPINPEITSDVAELDTLIARSRTGPLQSPSDADIEEGWQTFESDLVARFESDLKKDS